MEKDERLSAHLEAAGGSGQDEGAAEPTGTGSILGLHLNFKPSPLWEPLSFFKI